MQQQRCTPTMCPDGITKTCGCQPGCCPCITIPGWEGYSFCSNDMSQRPGDKKWVSYGKNREKSLFKGRLCLHACFVILYNYYSVSAKCNIQIMLIVSVGILLSFSTLALPWKITSHNHNHIVRFDDKSRFYSSRINANNK